MRTVLIALNALVSLASVAWAVIAVVRPSKLSASTNPSFGERYFARLYAVRSVPLELASAALPLTSRGKSVFVLLVVSAAIQGADVGVAVAAGKKDMTFGAGIAAVVHALCALSVR